MQRQHIITISGKPGSGKSSTADQVAELLSYTRFSSGDMVREVLKQKEMTLLQFNKRAVDDHKLDHDIDEELRKLRDSEDIVIDSRLGFYWIPESFKVYLDLNMDVASARVFSDIQENEKRSTENSHSASLGTVAHDIKARMENERKRYQALYGIDPYDSDHFDLVINTARHSPQTVALTVHDHYRKWLQSDTWEKAYSEVPFGFSHKNQY